MSRLLEATGVGVSFGAERALTSAGLWVEEGEVTALLGRNGAGKTTLLRVAAGRLRPDHGSVIFRGEASPAPGLAAMARGGLFFLPERDLLSAPAPVGAQLGALARRTGGRNPAEAAGRFRLEELTDLRPRELSGGERRRAEMAAAWLRRPACLLADEPFLGIAPRDRSLVADTLEELAADGCGVVVTGHEKRDLLETADRVIWIRAGTTRELGTPPEAVDHPEFARGWLGGAGGA